MDPTSTSQSILHSAYRAYRVSLAGIEQTFARARNVEWRGGIPVITESSDPYNTGFKGFLASEELVRLIQRAEFIFNGIESAPETDQQPKT